MRLYIFMFIFVFIDQISKILVDLNIGLNKSISIIPNFFDLTYVHNTGAAFSMFEGARWIFVIIAIIFLNVIFQLFIKNKELNKKEVFVYSLLLAGIIGNLIDRVLYGYVIDFLDFTILGYDFAIFNLADTFIVISIILIFIGDSVCKNSKLKNK